MAVSISSQLTTMMLRITNSEKNWTEAGKEAPLINKVSVRLGAAILTAAAAIETIACVCIALFCYFFCCRPFLDYVNRHFISATIALKWNLQILSYNDHIRHRGSFLTNELFVRMIFFRNDLGVFDVEDETVRNTYQYALMYLNGSINSRNVFASVLETMNRIPEGSRHGPLQAVYEVANFLYEQHHDLITAKRPIPHVLVKEFIQEHIAKGVDVLTLESMRSADPEAIPLLFSRMAFTFVLGKKKSENDLPSFISEKRKEIIQELRQKFSSSYSHKEIELIREVLSHIHFYSYLMAEIPSEQEEELKKLLSYLEVLENLSEKENRKKFHSIAMNIQQGNDFEGDRKFLESILENNDLRFSLDPSIDKMKVVVSRLEADLKSPFFQDIIDQVNAKASQDKEKALAEILDAKATLFIQNILNAFKSFSGYEERGEASFLCQYRSELLSMK